VSRLSFHGYFLHVTEMAVSKQLRDTTREPNLSRNSASGRYYGRFTLSGKQKWVNPETDVWKVAKIRLADERAKIERLRQTTADRAMLTAIGTLRACGYELSGDYSTETLYFVPMRSFLRNIVRNSGRN
jgi:hypothetical protein